MAEDCPDGDYLGAYSRFFSEFVARVNPYDQLPVSVSSCNVTKAEIVGEIINVTLQYLNQTQCPQSLQPHLVHQVIQEIKSMCKKQPEDCGFRAQEKVYTSLKLMQAITSKVNEICTRYLDNSRLALLPPPFSTPVPEVAAGGSKNCRRKMEDRYTVVHDLHTIFGIEDDSVANYYAVFDGHAGQDAAVYCATHLHQYLAESRYYPTDPERALHDAFLTTDAQFIEKSKTQKICGGTTAVCTLILNKKLYVAWVGDSTATLIKRDSVVHLVNPHRLHREDEVQRIRKTGGVVMQSMGIMRVNGFLSVSRAIGDVRYKPFVTGEPEIRTVLLDGTEDFLVLATDGLTDHLEPREILTVLYHEIQRNPNGYKRAHQILLQWAKHAGSKDNITVVVVLLTPASEIAARPLYVHPYRSPQVNEILEKMNSKDKPLFLDIDDAHNAINSNILKQTMIGQEPRDDDGILAASNGKHENGDADYDYSDLGPETDVDAIDDVPPAVPVKNLPYEFYKDNNDDGPDRDSNLLDNMNVDQSANANFNANANIVHEKMIDNNLREDDEDEDNDIRGDVRDEIALSRTVRDGIVENIHGIIHEEMDNRVREQLDDEEARNDEVRMDELLQDVVDEAGPMDYDDSPPSPQANKPLQHALINEADNVAESEDSEDEWNYYRVDPNKEKDSSTPVNESLETRDEEANEVSDRPIEEDNELKIQSEGAQEDIKCEESKEEPLELIDTEISTVERTSESEDKERARLEEQENLKDMDFQLNPNAAEFIPVSPQFNEPRMSLIEDFPVSGSPFKQVPQMDDIQVPSQSEFEKEVCQRPREVESDEKEYQNGDNLQRTADCSDLASERQRIMQSNLDDSEISSTKAEFGDESTASFLTASEFHRTGITVDESFSSSERDYDISRDPMAMSYTPSDFEAAFDKGVDLNAVHNLSNTDLEEKTGTEKEDDEDLVGERADFQADSADATRDVAVEETVSEVPEEPAVLVNLSSSHEEDREESLIEPAVEPPEKKTIDLLNLQSESCPDQPEIVRYDHSPLTENYSGEFESEKEPVSVDNEQPLSPSSVDIDETKPIDEASEDAVLPESELQKEACTNEADTPSSLSPVPDPIEEDIVDPTNAADNVSALHAGALEFVPGHYGPDDNEACQLSPMEVPDVCQMSSDEPAESAFEPIKENLVATLERDEKEIDEVCMKPAVQENLLNFVAEEDACAKPPQFLEKVTPPASPQDIEKKIVDDVVCPFEPSVSREDEDKLESRETPEETNLIECKKEIAEAMEEPEPAAEPVKSFETMEPMKELTMSASLQEFAGLESQFHPIETGNFACDMAEDVVSVVKQDEVKEDVQPEKLVDFVSEEQCKIQEEVKVVSLPSETKEVEQLGTKEVEQLETKEVEQLETKEVEQLETKEVEQLETKEVEQLETKEVEQLEMKEPEVSVPEIKPEVKEPEVEEPKEKVEVKESKATEVAAAVAATAVVAAAGAAAVQSKAKPKTATVKSAKTTTTKTAAPKSNPTSPSKTTTAATRTSTAATKKPSTIAAARPKDLDAPKKSTVSSTTASKPLTPKSAKSTTVAAAAKPSTTRVGTSAAPKPKSVASPKPSDKKPTANGDVKPLSKPATNKPAVTKSLATKTSTTSTKSSTTARPAGTTTTVTMSKPRPTSAVTKTTSSVTTKSSSTAISSTTSTTRPKTAPASGAATKTRLSVKSPIIDKQVKETANKQISMARTTAGASKTSATRLTTTSSATSTTVRRASSTTKTAATSQTKKSTTTTSSKVTKSSTAGKTGAEKGKIVQNGISGKVEINAIIDDVPKKDLSPVVAPNDNQLIASSD